MRSFFLYLVMSFVSLSVAYSQQAENYFGSYLYADEKISLNLSPPNAYTLFQMEQDRRTGAVTSKELSRGTFEVNNSQIILEEFPTRDEMKLALESDMVLEAENLKAVAEGEKLRAWSKQYENGQTRLEGGWKRGKKHGIWVYYNEEGDIIRREVYRRGKLKN